MAAANELQYVEPVFNPVLESLKTVTLHDLPVAVNAENGAQIISSPVAAFEYAGNWYIAPQKNNKVPTDPKEWSLVAGDGSPNLPFYHSTPGQPTGGDRLGELRQKVGDRLSAKKRVGTLPLSNVSLAVEDMEKIVLSKEHAGSGLQLGDGSFIHALVNEHPKAFEFTTEEIMRANADLFSGGGDAYFESMKAQRAALHQATGMPFRTEFTSREPQERVFYSIHPNEPERVHRIKVGFAEELTTDGVRIVRPNIQEQTVSLADVAGEIGDKGIRHAPEGIGAYLKGDSEGLSRYAETQLAGDFKARKQVEKMFSRGGTAFYQSTTNHQFGEELKGSDVATQAWHRVVRSEDYVPQLSGDSVASRSEALAEAGPRILDTKRADYFIVRQHPDYTKELERQQKLRVFEDYSGPKEQLLFLKGDPAGLKPAALEAVDMPKNNFDAIMELRKRGISQDSKLLKIGDEEYAELWHQRNLKEHIDYNQLERETARDTLQTHPLKYHKFGVEHPLAEPIHFNEAGKLVGDVDGLSSNGLYKLGEDSFVHITPDLLGNEKFHYDVYKKAPTGVIESAGHESCMFDGEFEYKLTDLIKQNGALKQASESEFVSVAQHLSDASKTGSSDAIMASHKLDLLLSSEKPKLPERMGARLQQASEGTLEGLYSQLNPRKKPMPPKIVSEVPKDANAAASETVSKATITGEQDAARVASAEIPQAANNERAFARFIREEKWMGKKGAIAAGATVVIGAIIYGVHKTMAKKQEPQADKPWASRMRNTAPNNQQAR